MVRQTDLCNSSLGESPAGLPADADQAKSVCSLVEFINVIRARTRAYGTGFLQNPRGDWLFRGQADARWPLLPKVARAPYVDWDILNDRPDEDAEQLLEREAAVLVAWQTKAAAWTSEPRNILEWMALGQHYGLPTRLLDWTSNPLTALWFAVEAPMEHENDAAVWLHRPDSISSLDEWSERLQTWAATEDVEEDFSEYKYTRLGALKFLRRLMQSAAPVSFSFIQPRHFDRRFQVQEGLFSLAWNPHRPLATVAEHGFEVEKITIRATARRLIRKELALVAGISHATLFPGLEGTATAISEAVLLEEVSDY